jgi:DNA-binding NtrC family response regulator
VINADIRILSAAHERLEEMMREGKFREDLYFRLNTIMLTMPPLRARRDDITTLYMHYLDVFASTYETGVPVLTSGDVATLLAYDWPGNVRELRNVCERHVLAARRGAGSVDSALNDNRDNLRGARNAAGGRGEVRTPVDRQGPGAASWPDG